MDNCLSIVEKLEGDKGVCRKYQKFIDSECFLDKAHGRCGANVRRFYYNFVSGECKEFRYTGCLGNKNNFPSMNVCKRQCHHDWNNFAAMRLVDKKTGKAIVKAHESEKESTFCLGCRSLTLETLDDAEHSDHETTNFFKSELESQNSDCEFQKSLGLPDFITNYFCQ